MNQKTLLIITLVALGISVLSYRGSLSRGDRFERGQKFLSQLNEDNIHEIEIQKGAEKILLKKSDKQFVVTSKNNYPAKNEAINRFINDALGIELEKNVGSGDALAKELEVTADGEKTTRVVFRNEAGKDMVQFLVGKASEDGHGNYVQRLDGDDKNIYLTSKGVYLTTTGDAFLMNEIVDVSVDKIDSIQGKDFSFGVENGALKLKGLPAGKKESADATQVKELLSGLTFDKVFLADDPEVAALAFDTTVQVNLKDNSGYVAHVAKKENRYFLHIQGGYDMSKLAGVTIGQDDSQADLKEKSELLTRRDEMNDFNKLHGSWIYELSEYTAKKFLKSKADLMESGS